jgi:hypothetical protein
VVKNSRLASENEQLKNQLEILSRDPASGPDATLDLEKAVAGSSSVSAEEHSHLADQYNELSKKYQDLSQKIKYLERKNNAVMQKNKDMKESVRAWQEYADRQSGRQKPKSETKADDDRPRLSAVPQIEDNRPYMPSSPRSVATVRTPLSFADTGHSSPAPVAPLSNAVTEGEDVSISPRLHEHHEAKEAGNRSGSVTPKPSSHIRSSPQLPTGNNDLPHSNVISNTPLSGNFSRRLQSYLQAVDPSSSQTTEDESAEQAARFTQFTTVADDDDDDDDEMPQFVSERSLKRKRGQPSMMETYKDRSSDGTPVKPFRVKEEQLSSPPIIHGLVRKETIDLDDPVSTVLQTPRHLKPEPKPSNYSALIGTARHQRSSSVPFTQETKREDGHSRRVAGLLNVQVAADNPEAASTDIRAHSEPSDPTESVSDILRRLDPNTVAEPYEEQSHKRLKQNNTRPPILHGIFSESGEEPPPTDENATRLAPSVVRARLNRRLHGSNGPQLSTLTPATTRIKIEQNPTPPSSSSRITQTPLARTKPRNPQFEARSAAPDTPSTDDRPQWNMKALDSRPSARKPRVSPSRKLGRLRSKPVTELNVQDFKPNPVYNQGYSYAFSETVRKRSDRLCLPGCTNPQCCGSTFRTFAEAQAPLPSSQEEALLEDYLGEAYNNTNMTQMSSEERQELVLQARTKKMAKEAGKHREAYERRRTPPGFWRVDFPTTQERQEDRERAKEQEKKVIQERWLEAQRKGGKWIFRDE